MQERSEEQEGCEEGREREYVIRLRLPKFPKLLPDETHGHIVAAQKEMLLALRSMLDIAIERMDIDEKPEKKGPTRIEVE